MASQSPTRVHVSEIVQELLTITGWTEAELAAKVGALQPTLHRWKVGESTVSPAQRQALAKLLEEERVKHAVPHGTRFNLMLGGERPRVSAGSEVEDPWSESVQQLKTIFAENSPDPIVRRRLERWKSLLREQIELIAETTAIACGHVRTIRKREPVDD